MQRPAWLRCGRDKNAPVTSMAQMIRAIFVA
jgi:hypothetical protein